jgi:hypothetical protein
MIPAGLHENILRKLEGFRLSKRIPNLLFHGAHGTGKRTIVYDFINKIYDSHKQKIKSNVLFVNCAHGKGIKFIREELKQFAKTNNSGVAFKTIVLVNADSLTIDAQSALRRCIELFSYNTRFFIVVENKDRLLNPIVSRFCEIYVPEYVDAATGKVCNLHSMRLRDLYGDDDAEDDAWWDTQLPQTHIDALLDVVDRAYEEGHSSLGLMSWIRRRFPEHMDVVMRYHRIKSQFRCEKLLMLSMLWPITSSSSALRIRS